MLGLDVYIDNVFITIQIFARSSRLVSRIVQICDLECSETLSSLIHAALSVFDGFGITQLNFGGRAQPVPMSLSLAHSHILPSHSVVGHSALLVVSNKLVDLGFLWVIGGVVVKCGAVLRVGNAADSLPLLNSSGWFDFFMHRSESDSVDR